MMWHRRETRRPTENTKLNLPTGRNLPTRPIQVQNRKNASLTPISFFLLTVGVGVGTRLTAGSNIGTVRPAGDPRSEIGLHVTLVQRSAYSGYVNRVRNGQYSPMRTFM